MFLFFVRSAVALVLARLLSGCGKSISVAFLVSYIFFMSSYNYNGSRGNAPTKFKTFFMMLILG